MTVEQPIMKTVIEDLESPKKTDDFSVFPMTAFPMKEVNIKIPWGGKITFNPVTSFIGFAFLWGVSIWCMFDPDGASATLKGWKSGVALNFTWFIMLTKPVYFFFILWLVYKYGDVKLGKPDSKPDFNNLSYFSMLFSSGIAVGLFFYGVSEPLWHQNSNYYAAAGYHTEDEVDQFAINLTIFHWGITGWSQYVVVALCSGLASYKFGLPLTFRSGFYPLLGEYTWGWIGDLIDGFTIVTTVAGICTSLGIGAFQIVAGLKRLEWLSMNMTEDEDTRAYALTIWIITLVATVSVVSGLGVGIKYLSIIGFGSGAILMFLCIALEHTAYIFNLTVQTIGYYFQWSIFQLHFHTGAFGQLLPGEGRALDGLSEATWFQDSWTIFYMSWWTAWAGFVGLFIARISKGRTIRDVALYSFLAPLMYTIFWFCTFGGIGIRQARQAKEFISIGANAFNNSDYFLHQGSNYCYDVPYDDVISPTDESVLFTNSLPGITPVCTFNSGESDQAWFNVMYSMNYSEDGSGVGFGPIFATLSLLAITIYFITSSDSGSLIVDHLASNGNEDHNKIQHVFWALTEGAVATALLLTGGKGALGALQAGSVVCGLPFTVLINYMCQSIVRMCEMTDDVDSLHEKTLANEFSMPVFGGIFDVVEFIFSFGRVHEDRVQKGMDFPTSFQTIEFFKALFFPFLSIYRVYSLVDDKSANGIFNGIMTIVYTIIHIFWIALFISVSKICGLAAFGWLAFFLNGAILSSLRMNVRARFNIKGNSIEDLISCTFFYPQALVQMLQEFENGDYTPKEIDA